MSNIDLKPVPVSHLSETNDPENFYAFGYTDKNGEKKSARIPASLLGGKAHAKKYDGLDILTSKTYKLGASEEMYVGNIAENVVLSETNITSCYGTLYMFVKNDTTEDKTITFPTASYSFFPQGKSVITVPAQGYIELAIKGYGNDRVVTDILSVEDSGGGGAGYDITGLLQRVTALEDRLNTFLREGGTIGGNLKVEGDINAQRILKEV